MAYAACMDKLTEKIEVFEIQAPSGRAYRVGMRQALLGAWISLDKSRTWEPGKRIRPLLWVGDASQVSDLIEEIEGGEEK